MNTIIDLESYFQRIGYRGQQTTTIETLEQLHRLHAQTITFENLNPFLGIPVSLDAESLQQKLVYSGRGGYCFEQNLLFKHALEAIGFSVRGLAARVLWDQPQDRITRKTHMLLLISFDDKKYIADVGFGAVTLTGTLLLESDQVQSTPHEPFRIFKHTEGYYIMESLIRGEWKTLYRFDLEEQFIPDYEMTNWYLSNHQESKFVNELIVSRPDIGRRYTLHNNVFKEHLLNGNTVTRTLENASDLKDVFTNAFKLTLPDTFRMDEVFEKVIASKGKSEK